MNLPNKLTTLRLFLAIIVFVLLAFVQERDPAPAEEVETGITILVDLAMVLFIAAAITDSLDGYLARRDRLVTSFGVVADPLMDKIVVLGILIFMCGLDAMNEIVRPWMVVVISTREFLITGLRGFAESKGGDLFAKLFGKLKMVVQCVTLVALFLYLGHLRPAEWARVSCQVLTWLTVILTLASGFGYVPSLLQLLREDSDL